MHHPNSGPPPPNQPTTANQRTRADDRPTANRAANRAADLGVIEGYRNAADRPAGARAALRPLPSAPTDRGVPADAHRSSQADRRPLAAPPATPVPHPEAGPGARIHA